MTHQLGFQRYPYTSATSTFNQINLLAWTNIAVERYTPQPPALRGGEYGNVTETIEVMFYSPAALTTEVQAALNRIETWLQAAKARSDTGVGDRVYVYLQIDGDTMPWRSEVLDGMITLSDGALQTWGQAKLLARISFTRRYFWEGNESEIALTSQTQTALAIGGRIIQNRKDTTGGNYVDIPPGRVLGVLPTPAKIILRNNTPTPQDHRVIYMASTGPLLNPNLVNYVIEAENAIPIGQGISHPGAASNGMRLDVDLVGVTTVFRQWTIGASTVAGINGRWARILMRVLAISGSGNVLVTAQLKESSGTLAAGVGLSPIGDEVRLSSTSGPLYDLGSIRFPTSGADTPSEVRLQLNFHSTSTTTLEIDYIMLMLGDGKGFRTINNFKTQVQAGAALVDDGPRGIAYLLSGGLEDYSVQAFGPPMWLYPGEQRTQRLYFLLQQTSNVSPTQQAVIQVHHRPRRLTV